MKKEIWLIIVLGIVIIILAGISLWPIKKPANTTPTPTPPVVLKGIQITSLKANEEISLPVKITGTVNGDGWVGFEGQVGHVDLVSVSDGLTVGSAPLKATSEWTKLPTTFEATVTLSLECVVAPCNWSGNANLVFYNENPSGDPAKDKIFTLPVKVK